MSATLAVGVFVAAYALIATEKANRVAVALTGAGLMLAFGLVSSADAFHSERFGIDWDVIFLLLGMMLIVGVIKQTGLFDYLAIWSAKRAGGRPFRILATLTTITAAASALHPLAAAAEDGNTGTSLHVTREFFGRVHFVVFHNRSRGPSPLRRYLSR